ncbi:hypothetical protein [Streptomyces sp. B21-083]
MRSPRSVSSWRRFRDPGTQLGGFCGQRYEGGSEVDAVLIG